MIPLRSFQWYNSSMVDVADVFLAKAEESLAGAESEFANGRHNNCANRCYYACFQAAICALLGAGIRPHGTHAQWGHDFVQAAFVGQLINRRKLYPENLRDVLVRSFALRQAGDYGRVFVTDTQVLRILRRAREFLAAAQERRGDSI
ncbi:MAG: HEPN domain-containing protein [Chloroflexi bacterium]|nr:HEPN domain-containing protein [Chloroflexota bacterium]